MSRIIFLLMATCFFSSCSQYAYDNSLGQDKKDEMVEIVSMEDALNYLDAFLEEVDMLHTKSGALREVASVETFYGEHSVSKSGDPIPDAYIVNFSGGKRICCFGSKYSSVSNDCRYFQRIA